MSQPSATFLMAVYNGERYVAESVESVLAQDDADFKFLIIDDASTDRSSAIIAKYAKQDGRIEVIRNASNVGLTKSLNIGLRHSDADLILRIDADDLCERNRLKLQRQYIHENADCMILGTAAMLIDSAGQRLADRMREAFDEDELAAQLFFSNPLTHSSVAMRREYVLTLGGYDESYVRAQDYALWLRCLSEGARICMLHDALVQHRRHDSRVTVLEPAAQDESRRRAITRTFSELLSFDPDTRFADTLHFLRSNARLPAESQWREFRQPLRTFRNRFARVFSSRAGVVDAFEHRIATLAGFMIPDEQFNKESHVDYIAGGSLIRFLSTSMRAWMHRSMLRSRFHVGRLRKMIRVRIGSQPE